MICWKMELNNRFYINLRLATTPKELRVCHWYRSFLLMFTISFHQKIHSFFLFMSKNFFLIFCQDLYVLKSWKIWIFPFRPRFKTHFWQFFLCSEGGTREYRSPVTPLKWNVLIFLAEKFIISKYFIK